MIRNNGTVCRFRSVIGTILFCTFISVPHIFAQQKILKTAELKEGTQSGEYVVYRDYSWKNPTWIGFLYYDDNTYGAFLHTPKEKSRVAVLFSCEVKNSSMNLTGQKIISSITQQDTFAVNYLMTLLPTFFGIKMLPHGGHSLTALAEKDADIYTFGGQVSVGFENTIPLFHIKTVKSKKTGLILELEEQGSVTAGADLIFYNYTPHESVQESSSFKRNPAAKTQQIMIHGKKYRLDSQWTKIADNSFLCGNTAFLTVTQLRPPVVSDTLSDVIHIIKRFKSSGAQAKVLIPYSVVTGLAENFTVAQLVYDVPLKKINKDIKQCIKNKDGTYTVISLTVDRHAYNTEKNYFDSFF